MRCYEAIQHNRSLSIETKMATSPKSNSSTAQDIKELIIGAASASSGFPIIVADEVDALLFEDTMCLVEKDEDRWGQVRTKIALMDGEVILVEYPGQGHEQVKSLLGNQIAAYNFSNTQNPNNPLRFTGSTRVRYGDDNSFEPDQAFIHRNIPQGMRPLSSDNRLIPSVVFEVASSEDYPAIQRKTERYLANDHVRLVLWIKVVYQDNDRISQLYAIVYSREGDGAVTVPRRVISFGPSAHPWSIAAIIDHTHVLEQNFVGIGRPGPFAEGYAYPQVIQTNEAFFSITIPKAALYYPMSVPDPDFLTPCTLSLCAIVAELDVDVEPDSL